MSDTRAHKLKAGDMVRFVRSPVHSHYGVYDGEGNVYHLTGPSKAILGSGGAEVKKENLLEVAGSSLVYKDNTREATHCPMKTFEILALAELYLEEGTSKEYNLRTFNCETFASMLRYGRGISKQVRKILTDRLAGTSYVSSKLCRIAEVSSQENSALRKPTAGECLVLRYSADLSSTC